jgi:hypothetical protein
MADDDPVLPTGQFEDEVAELPAEPEPVEPR